MTVDPYWDELGIAWCAINPDIKLITPRLEARLRRQTALIMTGLVLGLPLIMGGICLAGYTVWLGWATGAWNFVTRGIAILAVSLLAAAAWSRLLAVRTRGDAGTMFEMLDLAIARAERTRVVVRLGLYACAAAMVLGSAGAAIRTYSGKPPALSPVIDTAVLAVIALGLFVCGRHAGTSLAKFRHLRRALADSP